MSTRRPPKLDKPDRGPRNPDDDELALWHVATREAKRLELNHATPTKPHIRLNGPRAFSGPERPPPSVPARRFYPDASAVDPLTESTPGLDRKTAKMLKKGERTPEAKVDLHGLTLDSAHRTLMQFILREYANGSRCVLVVTGKGGDYRGRAIGYGDGRGAIKRDVPRWLREPALSGAVVGIYQAHKRHGGEGALYVYLKRFR